MREDTEPSAESLRAADALVRALRCTINAGDYSFICQPSAQGMEKVARAIDEGCARERKRIEEQAMLVIGYFEQQAAEMEKQDSDGLVGSVVMRTAARSFREFVDKVIRNG